MCNYIEFNLSIYFSKSFRLICALLPFHKMKSANLSLLIMFLSLFSPIRKYSAASSIESVYFSHIGISSSPEILQIKLKSFSNNSLNINNHLLAISFCYSSTRLSTSDCFLYIYNMYSNSLISPFINIKTFRKKFFHRWK